MFDMAPILLHVPRIQGDEAIPLMLLSVNVCDSCYQALTTACFSSAIDVKLHHDVIKADDNEYGSNKISAILPLNSVIEFSTCLLWGGMAPFFSHSQCWFHWTRYSGYILQVRWINLWSSDVTFLLDSVYQKLLNRLIFYWAIFKKINVTPFWPTL